MIHRLEPFISELLFFLIDNESEEGVQTRRKDLDEISLLFFSRKSGLKITPGGVQVIIPHALLYGISIAKNRVLAKNLIKLASCNLFPPGIEQQIITHETIIAMGEKSDQNDVCCPQVFLGWVNSVGSLAKGGNF